MMRRSAIGIAVLLWLSPAALAAQNQTLIRALAAYDALDYETAITSALQAVQERLSTNEHP